MPGSVPLDLAPMLATGVTERPTRGEWAFEIKWDGIRTLARIEDGHVQLITRNGNDITARYPELQGLGEALGGTAVLLDGEVTAFDEQGRPSFQRLQRRMSSTDAPVAYMIFDILWVNGELTTGLPYTDRRLLLEELALNGPSWQTPPIETGTGEAMEVASRALGLEGFVAKRLDSPYEPGRRSRSWLKIKHHREQEFVVGGWHPGEGSRASTIGGLLIGYHDADGALQYAGRVGSGLNEAELLRVRALLEARERSENPFAGGGVPKLARFVDPDLVVSVRFAEWTADGRVRQPVYRGLRDDKLAADVVREP